MSDEQKELNRGSSDFFGLNHYGSDIVRYANNSYEREYMDNCPEWPTTGSSWLFPVPWAFRSLLNWIDTNFDSEKYPIMITENGLSSKYGDNGTDFEPNLNDQFRINFYNGNYDGIYYGNNGNYLDYIGQMHRAMTEDKVNVEAYTAWSLMDNFEWARGYTERFGLHWTNYTGKSYI